MTGLGCAEQAVERARTAVVRELTNPTEWISGEIGATDKDAAQLADALVRAVRELVACEIERSEFQRGPISGSNHYVGGYSDGLGDAARIAREGLTKEKP